MNLKLQDMDGGFDSVQSYQDSFIELASKTRSIFINENFTKELAATTCAMLLYLESSGHGDITIYINSNGGDAAAMCQIYDIIKLMESPIKTVCLGKCYSAGGILLSSGTKGKRYIMPHGEVMIHGLQCLFPAIGDEAQIDSENYYQFINNYNESIMQILAKNTGKSIAKVRQDCEKDMFLSPKEAIAYGLVDHIL